VDAASLRNALVKRTLATSDGLIETPLSVSQAVAARDALAKAIYGRMFDQLISMVNRSLGEGLPHTSNHAVPEGLPFIGVLDIYGFENLSTNGFETLFINYSNEKLQMLFNSQVFKMEAEVYRREGIHWDPLEFPDNQACVDLLEKRPGGIFSYLDEECLLGPRGSEAAFLSKVQKAHSKNAAFSLAGPSTVYRRAENDFVIKHYAGPILYSCVDFLDKNRDTLTDALVEVMRTSSCSLLAPMFRTGASASSAALQLPGTRRTTSSLQQTLSQRFTEEMNTLLSTIRETRPTFVRCIKPNSSAEPRIFDSPLVLSQLLYAGVLAALNTRRAGWPSRIPRLTFFRRYGAFLPSLGDRASVAKIVRSHVGRSPSRAQRRDPGADIIARAKDLSTQDFTRMAAQILKRCDVASADEQFRLGISLVFLRSNVEPALDTMLKRTQVKAVQAISTFYRSARALQKLRSYVKAVVLLQSRQRMRTSRRLFNCRLTESRKEKAFRQVQQSLDSLGTRFALECERIGDYTHLNLSSAAEISTAMQAADSAKNRADILLRTMTLEDARKAIQGFEEHLQALTRAIDTGITQRKRQYAERDKATNLLTSATGTLRETISLACVSGLCSPRELSRSLAVAVPQTQPSKRSPGGVFRLPAAASSSTEASVFATALGLTALEKKVDVDGPVPSLFVARAIENAISALREATYSLAGNTWSEYVSVAEVAAQRVQVAKFVIDVEITRRGCISECSEFAFEVLKTARATIARGRAAAEAKNIVSWPNVQQVLNSAGQALDVAEDDVRAACTAILSDEEALAALARDASRQSEDASSLRRGSLLDSLRPSILPAAEAADEIAEKAFQFILGQATLLDRAAVVAEESASLLLELEAVVREVVIQALRHQGSAEVAAYIPSTSKLDSVTIEHAIETLGSPFLKDAVSIAVQCVMAAADSVQSLDIARAANPPRLEEDTLAEVRNAVRGADEAVGAAEMALESEKKRRSAESTLRDEASSSLDDTCINLEKLLSRIQTRGLVARGDLRKVLDTASNAVELARARLLGQVLPTGLSRRGFGTTLFSSPSDSPSRDSNKDEGEEPNASNVTDPLDAANKARITVQALAHAVELEEQRLDSYERAKSDARTQLASLLQRLSKAQATVSANGLAFDPRLISGLEIARVSMRRVTRLLLGTTDHPALVPSPTLYGEGAPLPFEDELAIGAGVVSKWSTQKKVRLVLTQTGVFDEEEEARRNASGSDSGDEEDEEDRASTSSADADRDEEYLLRGVHRGKLEKAIRAAISGDIEAQADTSSLLALMQMATAALLHAEGMTVRAAMAGQAREDARDAGLQDIAMAQNRIAAARTALELLAVSAGRQRILTKIQEAEAALARTVEFLRDGSSNHGYSRSDGTRIRKAVETALSLVSAVEILLEEEKGRRITADRLRRDAQRVEQEIREAREERLQHRSTLRQAGQRDLLEDIEALQDRLLTVLQRREESGLRQCKPLAKLLTAAELALEGAGEKAVSDDIAAASAAVADSQLRVQMCEDVLSRVEQARSQALARLPPLRETWSRLQTVERRCEALLMLADAAARFTAEAKAAALGQTQTVPLGVVDMPWADTFAQVMSMLSGGGSKDPRAMASSMRSTGVALTPAVSGDLTALTAREASWARKLVAKMFEHPSQWQTRDDEYIMSLFVGSDGEEEAVHEESPMRETEHSLGGSTAQPKAAGQTLSSARQALNALLSDYPDGDLPSTPEEVKLSAQDIDAIISGVVSAADAGQKNTRRTGSPRRAAEVAAGNSSKASVARSQMVSSAIAQAKRRRFEEIMAIIQAAESEISAETSEFKDVHTPHSRMAAPSRPDIPGAARQSSLPQRELQEKVHALPAIIRRFVEDAWQALSNAQSHFALQLKLLRAHEDALHMGVADAIDALIELVPQELFEMAAPRAVQQQKAALSNTSWQSQRPDASIHSIGTPMSARAPSPNRLGTSLASSVAGGTSHRRAKDHLLATVASSPLTSPRGVKQSSYGAFSATSHSLAGGFEATSIDQFDLDAVDSLHPNIDDLLVAVAAAETSAREGSEALTNVRDRAKKRMMVISNARRRRIAVVKARQILMACVRHMEMLRAGLQMVSARGGLLSGIAFSIDAVASSLRVADATVRTGEKEIAQLETSLLNVNSQDASGLQLLPRNYANDAPSAEAATASSESMLLTSSMLLRDLIAQVQAVVTGTQGTLEVFRDHLFAAANGDAPPGRSKALASFARNELVMHAEDEKQGASVHPVASVQSPSLGEDSLRPQRSRMLSPDGGATAQIPETDEEEEEDEKAASAESASDSDSDNEEQLAAIAAVAAANVMRARRAGFVSASSSSDLRPKSSSLTSSSSSSAGLSNADKDVAVLLRLTNRLAEKQEGRRSRAPSPKRASPLPVSRAASPKLELQQQQQQQSRAGRMDILSTDGVAALDESRKFVPQARANPPAPLTFLAQNSVPVAQSFPVPPTVRVDLNDAASVDTTALLGEEPSRVLPRTFAESISALEADVASEKMMAFVNNSRSPVDFRHRGSAKTRLDFNEDLGTSATRVMAALSVPAPAPALAQPMRLADKLAQLQNARLRLAELELQTKPGDASSAGNAVGNSVSSLANQLLKGVPRRGTHASAPVDPNARVSVDVAEPAPAPPEPQAQPQAQPQPPMRNRPVIRSEEILRDLMQKAVAVSAPGLAGTAGAQATAPSTAREQVSEGFSRASRNADIASRPSHRQIARSVSRTRGASQSSASRGASVTRTVTASASAESRDTFGGWLHLSKPSQSGKSEQKQQAASAASISMAAMERASKDSEALLARLLRRKS
jgi:hypothetical protein